MSLLRKSLQFYSIGRLCVSKHINGLNFSQRRLWRLYCSSSAISHPTPDGCEKVYSDKIKNIVEEIAKLTLIEVADLNECLKKKLNIKDTPMMMGAMPVAAPSRAAEDEDAQPEVTKSSFTVKLMKFEESKKVAVIKEVKNHIEGMNLVQAKKFVESAPQILKADIAKDDAEKLKAALEAVGATCEIS
ncbi:39S ribosomal protein L12, mitochondrial-like [Stegodyphus dumicola]|uniref:39S ribosomal protein L12, mitochondrial-like n=1 Tax=Stegodyphus dumicola TaxID=202533 RepID=UPI0015B166BC|nr:39S ribosomal protein L12, mitochondrial-like [Stegodyphus dumicola]